MTEPKVTHGAAARILADRDPVIDRLLFLTGPPKLAPPVEGSFAWYCWRAAELYAGADDSALTR
jgi:hypothetical protein